ncbi:phosphatase PAP2 family protein [Taibaiella sp. KBW10]|uniref:phosphatase PAP2 family protein n=1 Tax=Taibaiella sp. KBW10 TaxID=2153357 RepID=UPI001F287576|nr:phosphatase PAP2 family protein [Taibaiella sp. KBW10]
MKITRLLCCCLLPISIFAQAQSGRDTLVVTADLMPQERTQRLSVKPFIIPSVLIGYGAITLGSKGLQSFNRSIRKEVYLDRPHSAVHIDDYLQYAPAATAFSLSLMGIKGKHDLKHQAIIYAMAMTISTAVIVPTKRIAGIERPDGSNFASFPSGHTATAFVAAEFLRREYKDQSAWYGIAGYAVATGTGFLRMYNNKHWFNDVVAGAGIGIAATTIAYWLHDKINWGPKYKKTAVVYPYYNTQHWGIGFVTKI